MTPNLVFDKLSIPDWVIVSPKYKNILSIPGFAATYLIDHRAYPALARGNLSEALLENNASPYVFPVHIGSVEKASCRHAKELKRNMNQTIFEDYEDQSGVEINTRLKILIDELPERNKPANILAKTHWPWFGISNWVYGRSGDVDLFLTNHMDLNDQTYLFLNEETRKVKWGLKEGWQEYSVLGLEDEPSMYGFKASGFYPKSEPVVSLREW